MGKGNSKVCRILQQMNNIAIIIPTLRKGGAEKQATLLASALSPKYNVKIIVIHGELEIDQELLALSGLDNESIIRLSSKPSTLYQLFIILKRNKFDTAFCYLTWPDFWVPIIGKLVGIRRTYQGLRNAELPKSKLLLEKIGNIFATGAITNNYFGADVFAKRGIKRQVVIPNCFVDNTEPIVRTGNPLITIITVGRFTEQKDYPTAISALSKLFKIHTNVRFKIIGYGNLETEIRQLVFDYGIDEQTEILINPPNIKSHLQTADIYLSTSLFEGTSNSIMEAMDASLPIIATNAGDNDRLVHANENGYIVPIKDVDAISIALETLINSKELRNQFGLRSNWIIREQYGFSAFRDSYMQILSE